MNWHQAAVLFAMQTVACAAAWLPSEATAPGGPVLLLVVCTAFTLSWSVRVWLNDRRDSRHLERWLRDNPEFWNPRDRP